MRTRRASFLVALMLLVNATPSVGAQAVDPSAGDGAPGTVLPAGPPAVDTLDVPQGGGLPEPPPQTGPGAVPPDMLAAGSPPLTQHLADGFAGALMWLLDAPLTEGQRQDLQDTVVQTWTGGDQAGIRTVLWRQGRTLDDYKQAGAAAWRQAMAQSQARHNTYVGLSTMLMANHVTMMNAINNIGSSPYTYVLR